MRPLISTLVYTADYLAIVANASLLSTVDTLPITASHPFML